MNREKSKCQKNMNYLKNTGITLVALVVTIVVLLILAGVSINLVVGQNGLINRAKEAAQKTKNAKESEMQEMDDLATQLAALSNTRSVFEGGNWNSTLGICTPKLGNNMVGVYWSDGSKNSNGTYKASLTSTAKEITSDQEGFSWNDWYSYVAGDNSTDSKNSKWANAKSTVDGSYFVWIPRYEYKLTGKEIGGTGTDKAGTITIKFIDKTVKTPDKEEYKIHPAFTTNLQLGGWDKEISGVWVAKYEMSMEQTTDNGATWNNVKLKNGNIALSDTTRTVSKPNNYSWNYINISNCFDNSLNYSTLQLTGSDSHLMKNSEWGAVAYLAQSEYGLNGTNIYINNVNLHSSTGAQSVYAITGCAAATADADQVVTEMDTTTKRPKATNVYTWTQASGTKASTTGTIYGIFDMSGGTWERTAAIVNNGNLTTFGKSLMNSLINGKSSKYVTVYPYDSSVDKTEANSDIASEKNYKKNTRIYGDGIRETSTAGTGKTSWYTDHSCFPAVGSPFFLRGGALWDGEDAGLFYFFRGSGASAYGGGFRAALVAK